MNSKMFNFTFKYTFTIVRARTTRANIKEPNIDYAKGKKKEENLHCTTVGFSF